MQPGSQPASDKIGASSGSRAFAPMSVVALLGLLIAAAMLPALALSGFLLQRTNRAQQDMVATLAEAAAGSALATVDRQLQGMISTLRGLSTANSLERGSLEQFYDGARSALAGTGTYLLVIDQEMNVLVNTRRPFGDPLGKTSDPDPVRHALQERTVGISNGFLGRTSQNWVFNVILPWVQAGHDPTALVLTQDAETLVGTLATQDLRGGWNAVVIDRNGSVLASTLMSSDTGKPFFLHEAALAGGQTRHAATVGGKSYEMIVKTSQLSGWRVVLWAESSVIERSMIRTFRLLLLGSLAMIAIGGLATWWVGRLITKSVRRLSDDAHRMGAGETIAATAFPVTELTDISLALSAASTARRESENEIRFLMREVAHRSKNQLTVVASLAKQSARNANDVAAFSDSFQQRLMGLSRSTDLLITGSVVGVEFGELLRVQVEPFRPADEARLTMQGPKFRLSLQAAQTLGLAIHELATNAAKYGAFSTPSGKLSVTWERAGDDLAIVWREKTAKAPKPSDKVGFGTQLIDRTLSGALGATIERTYHPDGLECRITLPVAKLIPEQKGPSAAGIK